MLGRSRRRGSKEGFLAEREDRAAIYGVEGTGRFDWLENLAALLRGSVTSCGLANVATDRIGLGEGRDGGTMGTGRLGEGGLKKIGSASA